MTALHHRVTGDEDAPTVLMGGSLGTELQMFNAQLPLADRLRLVCFDHRGHGGSPTPPGPYEIADLGRDVLELMDELELERASYCGLSIGGMVGIWLGVHAPERIQRLVLICTAAHMPPPAAWQERAAAVLEAGSAEPIADSVVDRWLTPSFATQHPEVRARLRLMLAESPARGYAWCCGAIERMDQREDLARIAAPTLVISGSDDLAAPPDMQRLIADAIPRASYEIVGPAAHVASVEQPDQINRLIGEFLS